MAGAPLRETVETGDADFARCAAFSFPPGSEYARPALTLRASACTGTESVCKVRVEAVCQVDACSNAGVNTQRVGMLPHYS